jgi:hypothetical protein
VEMLLLITMAFDRYMVIYKPLHYLTIISPRICIFLLVAVWVVGFLYSLVQLAFIVNLPFCSPVWTSFTVSTLSSQSCLHSHVTIRIHGHSQQWIHLCGLLLHINHFLYCHHIYCPETLLICFLQGSVHTFSSCHCISVIHWSFDVLLCMSFPLHMSG